MISQINQSGQITAGWSHICHLSLQKAPSLSLPPPPTIAIMKSHSLMTDKLLFRPISALQVGRVLWGVFELKMIWDCTVHRFTDLETVKSIRTLIRVKCFPYDCNSYFEYNGEEEMKTISN
ncbi:hypothetical protein NE237_014506 [Protea cynaroides]|uniref:Uncharacterized protein n=1 Tax=Protea cynaroides TaxID=273540 RepID=A0A9Q0KC96_9MAGN|nr:hypothetical protein NE237_014506 [Protea cynaroides]